MKKKKQPKKKKTFFERVSKLFLIFAILFFLLAISGISEGVISVFIFCLLCGVVCIFVSRLLKKNHKTNEQIAEHLDKTTTPDPASSFKILDDTDVEIVFPDGHSETHKAYEKVDGNDAVLISENGRTYHNKVGCFKKWSDEYKDTFTRWQLVSLEEARELGLRMCRFCYEYEYIKDNSNAFVEKLSCSAKKYQENLLACKVGEKCSIEYDYGKERYTVLCGDEIGYLPKKIADDRDIMLDGAPAFIDEITEQDDGKLNVRLVIKPFKVW